MKHYLDADHLIKWAKNEWSLYASCVPNKKGRLVLEVSTGGAFRVRQGETVYFTGNDHEDAVSAYHKAQFDR